MNSIRRMVSKLPLTAFLVSFALPWAQASERGLVHSATAHNTASLVGVSHGLPGIDTDVKNASDMATNPAYNYTVKTLSDEQGTTENIKADLTTISGQADEQGSFFFYFSGHGSPGSIYAQDRSLKIEEIRAALEEGRKNSGPFARLIMMYDSCFSGSLLDPIGKFMPLVDNSQEETQAFVDSVVKAMASISDEPVYKELFVFASSRANETSLAGDNGSVFTVALRKAFDETIASNATIGEFIAKTQTYTVGHHPVARLVPTTLSDEKMKP
jgi:Caspase domain